MYSGRDWRAQFHTGLAEGEYLGTNSLLVFLREFANYRELQRND